MVELTIDGQAVAVPPGTSILDAAASVGIDIPALCYDKTLSTFGACRLCSVEIEGRPNLAAACATPVTAGTVVHTESEAVVEARRTVLDLLLSDHPSDCLICEKAGDCLLQQYCYRYGVEHTSFVKGATKALEIDDDNHLIERDQNKCILCGKCVRVCHEVQATNAVDFAGRGFDSTVTTSFDHPLAQDFCRFCGQCVDLCPTGALVNKQLKGTRTWERTKVRTTCPFCGTGCNFDLNVANGKVVGVTAAYDAPVNQGSLCVKGRFHADLIDSPDRVTTPLIRKDGNLEVATWDEALDLVASRLLEIKEQHGSDALAVVSSARCTNEDNYVMQRFARAAVGTNNVDHCARICHAPTVAGLATSFGSGAMTNSIGEIEFNDVLFIIGSNATEAHPVIGNKMKKAHLRGAKLIVVDPRRTELAEHAHLWLPIRPGTDNALINGLLYLVITNGWRAAEFIEERCEGYDDLWAVVQHYPPERVSEITGVSVAQIREAAELYALTPKAGIFYTLGITEHTTGTANVMNLANLAMVTGHVGVENAGVNPLRGQNNVQGSCDMGALPNVFPGYRAISDPANVALLEDLWGVKLSEAMGLRIPEMFDMAVYGKLKAMYVMGEDPVLTDADANHVHKAMSSLDFLVVQDLNLTETARYADVFLPAACYAEKDGTFTNTERRVQRVRKAVEPPGQCRSDIDIICELSRRLGYEMGYRSAQDVFGEIRTVVGSYAGMTYQRLGTIGLQWPCPDTEHPGTRFLHAESFPRGKGLLQGIDYEPPAELTDEQYPILLSTGRMLYHYNIMTRHSANLDSLRPCELAEISPQDALDLGLEDGDVARVSSRRGSILSRVTVTDRVPAGMAFMTFHYKESPVNELTNGAADPVTQTAEFKVCAVKVEKASAAEATELAESVAAASPLAVAG